MHWHDGDPGPCSQLSSLRSSSTQKCHRECFAQGVVCTGRAGVGGSCVSALQFAHISLTCHGHWEIVLVTSMLCFADMEQSLRGLGKWQQPGQFLVLHPGSPQQNLRFEPEFCPTDHPARSVGMWTLPTCCLKHIQLGFHLCFYGFASLQQVYHIFPFSV